MQLWHLLSTQNGLSDDDLFVGIIARLRSGKALDEINPEAFC